MFLKRFQVRELAQAALLRHLPKLARMTEEELKAHCAAGAAVVDIRHGVDFAEGHFPGSLNVGLGGREFALCVGFFLLKQDRIFLVVDQPEQAHQARLELSRAGFGKVGGYIEAGRLTELHRLTQLNVFDLKSTLCRGGKPEILDVRSAERMETERDSGVEKYPACAAQVASFRIVFFEAIGCCLSKRLPERRSIKLVAGVRVRQRSMFTRWNGYVWQRVCERMRCGARVKHGDRLFSFVTSAIRMSLSRCAIYLLFLGSCAWSRRVSVRRTRPPRSVFGKTRMRLSRSSKMEAN